MLPFTTETREIASISTPIVENVGNDFTKNDNIEASRVYEICKPSKIMLFWQSLIYLIGRGPWLQIGVEDEI